jgi:hypothetical protein
MKKTEILTTVYTLSKEEYCIVEKCLKYCAHRFLIHPNCGIHKTGVKLADINKLIE